MSNQNNLRAFLEVTALAVMLFAVPIAYYHGRDGVLQWQNKLYYKVFGIREEHLQKFKERLAKEEAEDIAESEKVTQL
jgi:hypothetical protein